MPRLYQLMKMKGRTETLLLAAAVLSLLLAACNTALVNPEVPPHGPAAYEDGYLHGCASGFTDARRAGYQNAYRKDATRYALEPDYRAGWDEGHRLCFEEEEREPRMCGPGPETLSCP